MARGRKGSKPTNPTAHRYSLRSNQEIAGDELIEVLQIKNKIPRRKAFSLLEERVISILSDQGYVNKDDSVEATETIADMLEEEDEDEEVVVDGEVDEGDIPMKQIPRKSTLLLFKEVDVKLVFKEVASKFLRRCIVEGGKRSDGRDPEKIHSITSKSGLLPRAHGSALFTREETQVGGITLPITRKVLLQAKDGPRHILAEMSKSSPPPSKRLAKYAPLIHVMKVKPEKINLIIGSGGKKVRNIIEETSVDAIDTDDDGTIKIMAKDLASLEKSKLIINNLTFVPSVGDIYKNCEIKSITPYGVFVEISPGREGLCHISELSSSWLAKAEDAFKVGDHVDVKLIEVNEKGQLRLSRRALQAESASEKPSEKLDGNDQKTTAVALEKEDGKIEEPKGNSAAQAAKPSKAAAVENQLQPKKVYKRQATVAADRSSLNKVRSKKSNKTTVGSIVSKEESLVDEEAKIGEEKAFWLSNWRET